MSCIKLNSSVALVNVPHIITRAEKLLLHSALSFEKENDVYKNGQQEVGVFVMISQIIVCQL